MTAIRACFAMLAAYSLWLVGIELRGSQTAVRPYFSDIEGEVALFAVNTSLSVALLAGAALLLAFAAAAAPAARRDSRRLLVSQAAMFALLAADDRFQLHERLGWRLGVADHYVIFAWGVAELALLAAFFRPALVALRAAIPFVAGALLFGVSIAIDALVASDAWLRLSLEDLAKAWGAALVFVFGWETARHEVGAAPGAATVGTAISAWRRRAERAA